MAYNLVGKNFVPVDVAAKVTGRAKYAEDFRAEGMVFCKTLTSPIPHAKIRRIDTSAALRSRACGIKCLRREVLVFRGPLTLAAASC